MTARGAIARFTPVCANAPFALGGVMNKIPVFGTIGHAYGFAISQFPRLLGITWAPLAVSIAVSLMLTPGFPLSHLPMGDVDETARQTARLVPLTFAILLLIRSMVAAGVTELALGMRHGFTFVYFSLGATVWRFVGAWLLVFLLMIVLIVASAIALGILLALGGGALAVAFHGINPGFGVLAAAVILLAFYVLILFIIVRLTFLLPPVVVAEKKIDLARGWVLTRGNFWRIFVIGLALFIPLIAIGCVIFFVVFGTDVLSMMLQLFTLAMENAKQAVIQHRIDLVSADMRARGLALWPYTSLVNILVETFAYGLLYGASAFAYRALTPAAPAGHG